MWPMPPGRRPAVNAANVQGPSRLSRPLMDPFSRRRRSCVALELERQLEPDAEGGDLAVLDVDILIDDLGDAQAVHSETRVGSAAGQIRAFGHFRLVPGTELVQLPLGSRVQYDARHA